jgi:hypothetical protein
MPFDEESIYMILGLLAQAKIDNRAEWWFSASSGGGFGPGTTEADQRDGRALRLGLKHFCKTQQVSRQPDILSTCDSKCVPA